MGVTADATTGAMNVVDYAHHEIHQGSHFFVRDIADQAITTVFDLQLTTPDSLKFVHMLWNIIAEDEVDLFIYEDVTIVNAGTVVPIFNSNRNSTKVSTLTIKSQINASVGDANVDTATASPAIQLEHTKAGANRTATSANRDHEIILKRNTDYCFRAVFTKAAYIAFDLNWYEHTNKAYVSTIPNWNP